ncbi:hypothetical protein H2198_009635 [Neophaeococcomyces mojaviensis]|uniref:Uncharacterized protein n=1 Tax=Neophaeococcomyces mojaviensis TaxID=3383035 RepID=A0ACC2ZUG6_9EURO|nr:hypothetical protein H2198_009635 [Knufia sp. JES_112]
MKESSQDSTHLSDSNFMTTFFHEQKPPQDSVDHFRQIPWLNQHVSNASYKIIPTFSRHLKTSGEDYFFSRTINTPETIPHMISLRLKNMKTPDVTSDHPPSQSTNPSFTAHKTPTIVPEEPDVLCLLQLGTRGLDGHPATIHGGVTCAILDETMGLLCMLHDHNIKEPGPRDSLYTANLNVSYRAPIPTPSTVLVKTWLVKRQGRKLFSKGQIVDEKGTVLAEADGLWVVARREKL